MNPKLKAFIPLILIVLIVGVIVFVVQVIPTPKLEMEENLSTLVGTVEYVNGRTCRVLITQGDSHFDAASENEEADVIQLTFTNLEGSKSILVGDTVRFEYDYVSQVSEYLGSPHITVNQVYVG